MAERGALPLVAPTRRRALRLVSSFTSPLLPDDDPDVLNALGMAYGASGRRAESLAALFYLLTLYCFVRATQSPQAGRWFGASVVACLLGATAKETISTAPLLVLLYDRTFVSGTFREAWRRHARVYFGLAASWLVLDMLADGWVLEGEANTRVFACLPR